MNHLPLLTKCTHYQSEEFQVFLESLPLLVSWTSYIGAPNTHPPSELIYSRLSLQGVRLFTPFPCLREFSTPDWDPF